MTIITDRKKGFTLAEVLITLTIIGVVAALTIPSLLANVNDKTYDAKRKAFATRMAQALSQMDALNSYEAKKPAGYSGALTADQYAANYSSMNFITEGLSKVYKITNVCEFENFAACDFPSQIGKWWTSGFYYTKNYEYTTSFELNQMTAANLGGIVPRGAAFRTKNGESIIIWYNPRCIAEQEVPDGGSKIWAKEVCLFGMIDLDGAKKGPNMWSRDLVLFTVLHPDIPYLVTLNPWNQGADNIELTYQEAVAYCKNAAGHGAAKGSLTLASRDNIYAYSSVFGSGGSYPLWTSDVEGAEDDDYGWMIYGATMYKMPKTTKAKYLRCFVKSGND